MHRLGKKKNRKADAHAKPPEETGAQKSWKTKKQLL